MDIDGKPGTQKAHFNSIEIPFHFDGTKCFYEITQIQPTEMSTLPKVYINGTLTTPYEPRVHVNTTQMTKCAPSPPHLPPWKHHLGFIPNHVVTKTLHATTQMVTTVEAETREHMCDHIMTHLPVLKNQ